MRNGSLRDHIHGCRNLPLLRWERRYDIVAGVASALHYIHNEYDQVVVHRDLTSSNVMLDAAFKARLGDFGLARALNSGETSFTDVDPVGTWGYIDGECCASANFTYESDVYAFGVLVLEVVCGRPPLHKGASGFHVLVDWVSNLHGEGRLLKAVNQRLGGE
ncbi:unnamed protein product, partial [Musa textilis]